MRRNYKYHVTLSFPREVEAGKYPLTVEELLSDALLAAGFDFEFEAVGYEEDEG